MNERYKEYYRESMELNSIQQSTTAHYDAEKRTEMVNSDKGFVRAGNDLAYLRRGHHLY